MGIDSKHLGMRAFAGASQPQAPGSKASAFVREELERPEPARQPGQSSAPHPYSRLIGALQVAGGAFEAATGAGLVLAPEPTTLTKAAGTVMLAHGADTAIAGLRTLVSRQATAPVVQALAESAVEGMGAGSDAAYWFGVGANVAGGVGPGAALQVARSAAVEAAESSDHWVLLSTAMPRHMKGRHGVQFGHTKVGLKTGGERGAAQYFGLGGNPNVPNGVRFDAELPPSGGAGVSSVKVAVTAQQAQAGLSAAYTALRGSPSTWRFVGNNCVTAAQRVSASAGVELPLWTLAPAWVPFATQQGFGATAGINGAIASAVEVVDWAGLAPTQGR